MLVALPNAMEGPLLHDATAAIVFFACWLGYEPALALLTRGRSSINSDLDVVRVAWMRRMLAREVRIMDTNLIGHVLNSASFFASTNLLIIAAAAGLLFGGASTLERLREVAILQRAADWLLELKIALVVATLARGLLDFIWSIRQLNYCVALIGAAPERHAGPALDRFCIAAAGVLNPAMSFFNRGVRAYYFALAAAAWLIAGWAMALAAVAAFAILAWRQVASAAANGARAARLLLEDEAQPLAGGRAPSDM